MSGSRSGCSTSDHSSSSTSRTIRPGRASHGTLRCSTRPVSSNPRRSSAVTVSPMPWFHDIARLWTKSTSVSTYVPGSSSSIGSGVSKYG